MDRRDSYLPWPGITLAMISIIALLSVGTNIWLCLAIFVMWVGTLFLTGSRPPPVSIPPSAGPVK